jgi:Mg2+/citrate symporter
MRNNSDKDVIAIPKKAFLGIAPAVAIIAVLFAKDKAPEVLLFLIGISAGLIIGMNLKKKQE